jgi:hypothetical protein
MASTSAMSRGVVTVKTGAASSVLRPICAIIASLATSADPFLYAAIVL